MPGKSDRLLSLAILEFGRLLPVERRVIECVTTGDVAHPDDIDPEDPDSEDLDGSLTCPWSEDRTVRGEFLRWLCVAPEPPELIDPRGLRIAGARVRGELDLSFATVKFPIGLVACAFDSDCTMTMTQVKALSLSGSTCGSLNADGMTVEGGVFLDQLQARGEVRLLGAQIKGQLSLNGATLTNPADEHNTEGYALNADRMTVEGGVFFDRLQARGEVRLPGAQIKGQLSLDGATLSNPADEHNTEGYALSADGVTVEDSVFLRQLQARGELRLLGAQIKGTLSLEGATLSNAGSIALNAEHLSVSESIFLRDGFSAQGEVWFWGAVVGAIRAEGSALRHPGGNALDCSRIDVRGEVVLDNAQVVGMVRFDYTAVLRRLSLDRAEFSGGSPVGLTMTHASISGPFIWKPAARELEGDRFYADFSNAAVARYDDSPWDLPENTVLNLDGFVYDAIAGLPDDDVGRRDWIGDRIGWIQRHREHLTAEYIQREQTIRSVERLDDDEFERQFSVPADERESRHRMVAALHLAADRGSTYLAQPYIHLASLLRRSGYVQEARDVEVARQDALRESGSLHRRTRARMRFWRVTTRYGYEPWRPIAYVGLPVIVLGVPLYWLGFNEGLFVSTALTPDPEATTAAGNEFEILVPWFNPLVFSLDAFLPIVDFGQQSNWQPNGERWWGWLLLIYFWFEIAVGWVSSTLFVLGFTHVVRQE